MRQNDFLENEWPEDGLNESEAPAEEAESDCGLYAIDTPVSEEKLGEPKIYAEEDDTLNGSDPLFRFRNDHRMYRMHGHLSQLRSL